MNSEAWAVVGEGLSVRIRLTPRAGEDSLEGCGTLADGSVVLKARVRALPEDGAANTALCKLLARVLDCPVRNVHITGGGKARLKTCRVDGDGAALAGRLTRALELS